MSNFYMDEAKIAEGITKGIWGSAENTIKNVWLFITRKKKKDQPNLNEIKEKTNVLFIDDEPFGYIDLIRDAGWNANQVMDITNLDDEKLKRSHIIFLDYVGVGKTLSPSEQGIGLLKALKGKYPNKIIIFYSGHAGFSLGQQFRMADDWMQKNSDPYIFIQKIEDNALKINFV